MGLPFFVCVLMGVITATFGGVLRDIACNKIPVIFRRTAYATCSFFAAAGYWGGRALGVDHVLSATASIVIALGQAACDKIPFEAPAFVGGVGCMSSRQAAAVGEVCGARFILCFLTSIGAIMMPRDYRRPVLQGEMDGNRCELENDDRHERENPNRYCRNHVIQQHMSSSSCCGSCRSQAFLSGRCFPIQGLRIGYLKHIACQEVSRRNEKGVVKQGPINASKNRTLLS